MEGEGDAILRCMIDWHLEAWLVIAEYLAERLHCGDEVEVKEGRPRRLVTAL